MRKTFFVAFMRGEKAAAEKATPAPKWDERTEMEMKAKVPIVCARCSAMRECV